MDEIDSHGRQLLIDRPSLTRGRLSVYRELHPTVDDDPDPWFPRLSVSLKRAGTDNILWQWVTHAEPIDEDEPPPYGEEIIFEKYFELDSPIKTPRGLEVVFSLGAGATRRGTVSKYSAALYLYPQSFEDRGVQVGVIDFTQGLTTGGVPLYFRVNFPW
jgi:hypothetical protein